MFGCSRTLTPGAVGSPATGEPRLNPSDRRYMRNYGWFAMIVALLATICFSRLLDAGYTGAAATGISLGIALVVRALASLGRLGQTATSVMADALAGRAPSLPLRAIAVANLGAIAVFGLMGWLDDDLEGLANRLFIFIPLIAWTIWDLIGARLRLARERP